MAESTSKVSLPFVNTVNTFGLNILSHALALNPSKSAGLCAMNIYHCLSMIAAGSKNRNLAAFAQVLRFTPELLDTMVTNTLTLDRYSKSSPSVELSSASGVFPAKDFVLGEQWKKLMEETFEAEIGALELNPINTFIERETKGKFKDLIKPEDIAGAVLMLVTCLYFKASWASTFKKRSTKKDVAFFTFAGEEKKVAMMHKCEKIEYVQDARCQVAILPYESGDTGPKWKVAVILPKEKGQDAMKSLLDSFTTSPDYLRNLIAGSAPISKSSPSRLRGDIGARRMQKVDLHLPRFSLKVTLDLIPGLSQLGLSPVFSPSEDFAPISTGPLMISRATHDLFLEVNEEGTEVAAVTVVTMR